MNKWKNCIVYLLLCLLFVFVFQIVIDYIQYARPSFIIKSGLVTDAEEISKIISESKGAARLMGAPIVLYLGVRFLISFTEIFSHKNKVEKQMEYPDTCFVDSDIAEEQQEIDGLYIENRDLLGPPAVYSNLDETIRKEIPQELIPILERGQNAGLLDGNFRPIEGKMTKGQKKIFALYAGEEAGIEHRWKCFEDLWHEKNLQQASDPCENKRKVIEGLYSDEIRRKSLIKTR